MKLIFIDTGAFYALADRRDPAFDRVRSYYAESAVTLLTTEFIFAETMSLLTKRLGKKIAVTFGRGIRTSPRFRIEEPPADVRKSAWTLFCKQLDKDYDLIDCISFSTMESFKVHEAFGFDHHFSQYGFTLLPA